MPTHAHTHTLTAKEQVSCFFRTQWGVKDSSGPTACTTPRPLGGERGDGESPTSSDGGVCLVAVDGDEKNSFKKTQTPKFRGA